MIFTAKAGLVRIAFFGFIVFFCACSNYKKIPLTYDYVGNIEVIEVIQKNKATEILISVNGGKWYRSETITFHDIKTQVEDNSIKIFFRAEQGEGTPTMAGQRITLKKLEKGVYYLQYLEPNGVIRNIDKIVIE